jgi:hypothetical protein
VRGDGARVLRREAFEKSRDGFERRYPAAGQRRLAHAEQAD